MGKVPRRYARAGSDSYVSAINSPAAVSVRNGPSNLDIGIQIRRRMPESAGCASTFGTTVPVVIADPGSEPSFSEVGKRTVALLSIKEEAAQQLAPSGRTRTFQKIGGGGTVFPLGGGTVSPK